MGIFSKFLLGGLEGVLFYKPKTIVTVSSVAYNIAGDVDERGNFLKESLIYLTAAEESIGEKLPRMYLNSLGMKLKRAYKHAASLPQGLPTSSMQLWEYQDLEDAVQTLLDIDHGPGRFKVEDSYITGSNTAPLIENFLNQQYGWDSVTGKMASPPPGFAEDAAFYWYQSAYQGSINDDSPNVSRSYKVEFRHDLESETPDMTVDVSLEAADTFSNTILVVMISEWIESTRADATITRPFEPGDVTGEVVTLTTATAGARVTNTTKTVTTTTDGTTTTVRTKIVDATTSEAVSREYVIGTGEWPILDSIWLSRSHVEQTFFPSVPFRVDNKDMLADNLKDTENYQGITKMCSLMGLDAIQMRDQINDNKDIKEIDYCFLVAGANMNTESQVEMAYLYRFWDMCRDRSTVTEVDLQAWLGYAFFNRPKPKTNSLVIQDPESKNGAYKITIEWDYINKNIIDGVIAPVGHYQMGAGASVVNGYGATSNRSVVDSTIVSIRKQINSTQYEEIAISGAVHKNDVYQGHTAETLAKDARYQPDKNEGFLVPLHMGIFNSMSLVERTQLAKECLYLIFNCYSSRKQKWYETTFFKLGLIVVGIIVIILSWGTATPGVIAAWAAAFSATYGLLIYIVINLAIGYLISYVLGKWKAGFESVFGKKWAGVVMAVVQIVASAYAGGGKLDFSNWLKTAVQIIDVASQLFTAYVRGAMVVGKQAYDAFMDKAEEDRKLLEKLSNEFFGADELVSIDYLLELQKTLREDNPTVFLSRTLMVGSDVVDITLGQISEMADMNLQPRLQGIYT